MLCLNKRAERKHRSKTAEEGPEVLWVDGGEALGDGGFYRSECRAFDFPSSESHEGDTCGW